MKTKIVATIGPASANKRVLEEIIKNGVNVCRLNLSHNDYLWHSRTIKKIRETASRLKRNIAIMTDIQGARIRILNKKSLFLKKGEHLHIADGDSLFSHHYKKELVLDWNDFYLHIKRGDQIFIDDGLINLKVTKKTKGGCVAEVVEGGKIIKGKGVNIPAISHYLGFITEKDLKDLEFMLEQGVDFIAASFVGKGSDILILKKIIDNYFQKKEKIIHSKIKSPHFKKEKINLNKHGIVAKIERASAIRNLDDIIEQSDAVMVARGDLAIEMPQEKLGVLQKDIVRRCLKKKKPVIVATQMATSMLIKPRPTRAEILDITNAVADGADAILFSNETTVGKNPEKVIETAVKIIEATEKSVYNDVKLKRMDRLARLIFPKKRKRKRNKVIKMENLDDCLDISSLRQENLTIVYQPVDKSLRKKGAVVWSVE